MFRTKEVGKCGEGPLPKKKKDTQSLSAVRKVNIFFYLKKTTTPTYIGAIVFLSVLKAPAFRQKLSPMSSTHRNVDLR